jgi:hypothetical protein
MTRVEIENAIHAAGDRFIDDHGVLPSLFQMGRARRLFRDWFAPEHE